jgi:hypothetical protein
MSQRVGAERRPMTGSAISGNYLRASAPHFAALMRATALLGIRPEARDLRRRVVARHRVGATRRIPAYV